MTCRVCHRPVESGRPHNGCAPYLATHRRVDRCDRAECGWPPELAVLLVALAILAVAAWLNPGVR